MQAKEPIREAEIRVLHCSGILCGPRFRCCAQAFDPKSLAATLNQSISGFSPHFF